jgi:serine/threonine protein kinase
VVLELLEGKTLLETIQERQGSLLSEQDVKIVMTGLLNGIAHLSRNRVMHRDLKP